MRIRIFHTYTICQPKNRTVVRERDFAENVYHLLPFERVRGLAKLKNQHFRKASVDYMMIKLAAKPSHLSTQSRERDE